MNQNFEHKCTFLNSHGDITISWGEDDHDSMIEVIEKKMNEGYMFYVIEPKFFGLYKKQVVLEKNNINKLNKQKNIVIKDDDLDVFIKQSKQATTSINEEKEFDVKSVLKKDNFKEELKKENKQIIATKPPVGG